MKRSIIFMGNGTKTGSDFDAWLQKYPFYRIVNVQYQQARYGDNSIFVLYDDGQCIQGYGKGGSNG